MLLRPDVFDWPTRLDALATDFPPEVLVMSVGSNDHQDLTDASGEVVVAFSDEGAWDSEYSRRLGEAFDHFADTGTTVVWVGQMHSEDPVVGSTNRRIHRLAAQVAEDRPFVVVADLGDWLGSGEQPASACMEPDGVHLDARDDGRGAEVANVGKLYEQDTRNHLSRSHPPAPPASPPSPGSPSTRRAGG